LIQAQGQINARALAHQKKEEDFENMQQSAPKKQSKVLTSAEGNKRVSLEDRFEK
jgi:hypothetical protein